MFIRNYTDKHNKRYKYENIFKNMYITLSYDILKNEESDE